MRSNADVKVALFLLEDHALVVGKAVKASLSVVLTHAAFSKAAKWQTVVGKMNNYVVYAATAKLDTLYYAFTDGLFRCKEVKGKRCRTGIYVQDNIFKIFVGNNRHYRPKNFFLH